jgi:hypothetical protein
MSPSPRRTRPTKKNAAAPKASTRRATAKKPRRGATATSLTTSKAPKRGPAAGAAAKAKAGPRGTRRRKRRITAGELIELGVPRTTFQNWVTSGVLARTDQRGGYLATAAAEQRIKDARRRRRPG